MASHQLFSEQNEPRCDEIGQTLVVRTTVEANKTLVPNVAQHLHREITCGSGCNIFVTVFKFRNQELERFPLMVHCGQNLALWTDILVLIL